jgi:hypothetical protein
MPDQPASIVDQLPDADHGGTDGPVKRQEAIAAKEALRNSVTAKWALRLGGAESLVAGPPPSTFDRTMTIRDERAHGFHRIAVTAIEIEDADRKILLRHQRVTGAVVAMPLHLFPEGPMADRGWQIGRRMVHTGPRYSDFKPVETLFQATNLARPTADARAVGALRENLAKSATTSAAPWLSTLDWRHLSDEDIDVLAKLIADPRATGLERLYDGHAASVSPRLRRPIVVRLLDPSTDDRLRATLNGLVRSMPPGTYRQLLPEEQALLGDQALRLRSSALVARLSDQGADAVPMLLRLLAEDAGVHSWARRWPMLADIRRALSRLGRDAAAALPTVERLVESPRSPLINSSGDADAWRVAMVRMGKPVESLTFPSSYGADQIARHRERIRKEAARGPER